MLFWALLVISVLASAVRIKLARNWITERYPRVDRRLDPVLLASIAVVGIGAALQHQQQGAKLAKVQIELEAVRDYGHMSETFWDGKAGDLCYFPRLVPLMEGTFGCWPPCTEAKHYGAACSPENETRWHQAIDAVPTFPWSYYALALCHQRSGQADWRKYAQSALSIFEKTTQIATANPAHKEAKSYLEQLLAGKPN